MCNKESKDGRKALRKKESESQEVKVMALQEVRSRAPVSARNELRTVARLLSKINLKLMRSDGADFVCVGACVSFVHASARVYMRAKFVLVLARRKKLRTARFSRKR